jgi:hypothetical protein
MERETWRKIATLLLLLQEEELHNELSESSTTAIGKVIITAWCLGRSDGDWLHRLPVKWVTTKHLLLPSRTQVECVVLERSVACYAWSRR